MKPIAVLWMLVGVVVCMGQAEPAHVPVYIEDSPAALELGEQARTLRQQGRLSDAAGVWQRVVDEHAGKLVPLADDLYIEVAQWAWGQVAQDGELLAVYRQVQGPVAERALAAARNNPLEAKPFQSIVHRYWATQAGLDGGLDLAAVYLERADPSAAEGLLKSLAGHPDAPDYAARFHALSAVTAWMLARPEAVAHHVEQLQQSGDAAALAEVLSLTRAVKAPPESEGTRAEIEPDLVHRPLWRLPLRRDAVAAVPGRQQSGQPASGTLVVADEAALYIHELTRLSAVDRYSGRPIWTFETAAAAAQLAPVYAQMSSAVPDRRGALVMGDRVIAAVGQPYAGSPRVVFQQADAGSSLVALDRRDGQAIWRVEAQNLDPALDRATFQGTPLGAYDRVLVLLRRNQASGFQDVFVVAVNASDGSLLWRRHVSSAVTASRFAMGPPPQAMLAGGTLYVGDGLATVVAIDANSGRVRWARRLVAPGEGVSRGLSGSDDANLSPPVLVEAGLLVPSANAGGQVALLDPDTGQLRSPPAALAAQRISYLLPVGGDVLAVGSRATLLDGRTLSPRWSTHVGSSSADLRGVAAVTQRLAIIPATDRLRLLSLQDGQEAASIPLEDGGNAFWLHHQLVVADSKAVTSYVPWVRAYEALQSQARAAPADPRPGLSMAYLAAAAGETDAVREGARQAIAALQRADDTPPPGEVQPLQREVFDQMLSFGQADSGLSIELREEMLALAATVSAGADQEVAYHLVLGGLLEESMRPVEAVRHYQAVLGSPLLSLQLYARGGNSRQAGLEAHRRLVDLVGRHGREVYLPFEHEASRALVELQARGADPGALMELAAKYPLATVAPRALLAAAGQLALQGRAAEAVAPLRKAYAAASDPDTLAEIAGRLTEVYVQQARPRLGAQWLRRVAREHPTLRPLRAGMPVTGEAWIAELSAAQNATGGAPKLRLPFGQPRSVPGELLLPASESFTVPPDDRFLVREGAALRMYGMAGPGPRWEADIPDGQLVGFDQEQVIVWSPGQKAIWVMDTETGRAHYAPVSAVDALAALGDRAERDAQRPEMERRFLEQMVDVGRPLRIENGQVIIENLPGLDGYLVAAGEAVIVLAERSGGVAAIDRHTGRALWHMDVRVEQVSNLLVSEDVAIVSGARNVGTQAVNGGVQVIDLATGEARLPLLEDKDPPQWTRLLTARGEPAIAIGTPERVTAHRLSDGVVLWRITVPAGGTLTGRAWVSPELVVAEMSGGALLVIDADDGLITRRLEGGPVARVGVGDIQVVDGQWQVRDAMQALALAADGGTLWRSATGVSGDHVRAQWVSDDYVVLLCSDEDQQQRRQMQILVQPDGAGNVVRVIQTAGEAVANYTLFALERATGRVVAEAALRTEVPERLSAGTMLENHVVLQGEGRVIVVPGGPETASPAP